MVKELLLILAVGLLAGACLAIVQRYGFPALLPASLQEILP